MIYKANHNTLSIIKEIFINKVYDSSEVKIAEGDIVFDIGANVGVFSLYASQKKGTQVFDFEPPPENFNILMNNVNQNKLKNVKCFNYALGLENGHRVLMEGSIAGGHMLSHIDTSDKEVSEQSRGSLEVKSVKFASIKEELKINKIDFVKLDCEGAEGEIIKFLGKSGLNDINKMAIEFHDHHSILSHEEIISELERAGFKTTLKWDGISYFGYIYANR